MDVRKIVEETLIECEVDPTLNGFKYVRDAVELLNSGNTKITDIYEEVALKNKTTKSRAERGIRYLFNRLNFENENVNKVFGNRRLANKHMLGLLMHHIRKG